MGAFVTWSNDLSVGIQEIDEQHKMLVEILNELHEAVLERRGRDACGAILDRLAEYTRIHFAVEESLMRVLDYPDYEKHKEEHELLIDQVSELQKKFRAGGLNISLDLLHFLKGWLADHIVRSDAQYGPHFLSMGVQKTWTKNSWLKRLFG